MTHETSAEISDWDVAIVGMAGRFPGARNLDEYWQNLKAGVESISFFSDEEVLSAGADPALLSDPAYVKAGGVLEDIDLFDASFFGFTPGEAEIMDPQHRLFLECAWQALENAGYDPETCPGLIGVYAGTSLNSYILSLLSSASGNTELARRSSAFSGDKDYLATVTSYKLNLKGPSITVQTFCSTSLVALHLARQSLLNEECDLALVGGVSIRVPQKTGYLYQEGGISSSDGHVRAFDAQADGTIFSNGIGVVVLKRLVDAIAHGDCIYAVVKGSAINNDGSLKVSYTAPSVDGQAEVIVEALADAGIDPETISYVETHGTGTALGDPIEIVALTKAFRASTAKKGFCAIGAVKANIGHTDAAAGVAGLIKTVLALKHQVIPPSPNFERPNPKIDFAASPFYVSTALSEWKTEVSPRRAGVSAFGFGGTNAHVVLEEAPLVGASDPSRPWQLLALSARTDSALETATDQLAEHFRLHPDQNLADAAYTLLVGRRAFNRRRIVVCRDLEDAIAVLGAREPNRVFTAYQEHRQRAVVFMFSGQGAQYVNMGHDLYQREPLFREQVDACAELLKPHLGLDLRDVLYPQEADAARAGEQLEQTRLTQPALFVIEHALARLWMAWGVKPTAMIGHSSGEYVAACLAEVFSLEDALALVAARGRLMQSMPPGAMLSVPLAETDIQPLLGESLVVATVNSPDRCVVSGPAEAIAALEQQLNEKGVVARQLHTSHAFHSPMMEPILKPFEEQARRVELHEPRIPFVSNVTGTWITSKEATDPAYWAQHLRRAVRFSQGLSTLARSPDQVLLEVGPGRTLSALAQRHPDRAQEQLVISSMRHPQDAGDDQAFLLRTLGQLWLAGVSVDWQAFYQDERRLRVPLPTYPFERQRYWLEPAEPMFAPPQPRVAAGKKADVADWFYAPDWEASPLPETDGKADGGPWLIFEDPAQWGAAVAQQLSERGASVVRVQVGETFARVQDGLFTLRPNVPADYRALLDALKQSGKTPTRIAHLWSLGTPTGVSDADRFHGVQRLGFYSLLYLAQALDEAQAVQIAVVSDGLLPIGDAPVYPEKATLLGPCLVIPQEYQNIGCRAVEIVPPSTTGKPSTEFIARLVKELAASNADPLVAYQAEARYVRRFAPKRLEAQRATERLRPGGVYLIVGGLGNIGLTIAEYLAQAVQARLVLTGRSSLPLREEWDAWLAKHPDQDPVSRKIGAVRRLEAAGAEVLVLAANMDDEQQMRAVVGQTHEHFGALNGVIHAAGLVEDAARPIQSTDRADCERQFAAKVYGLYVLERVLQGQDLDFCLLCSSLSAVLGGLGFAAYAAANAFLDAYTHEHNRHAKTPWISVNWDSWSFAPGSAQATTIAEFAMTPEEGQRAFALAVGSGATRLVHSTGDLQARFRQWVRLERAEQPLLKRAAHARPTLTTTYVPASSSCEKQIAAIWQDVLGIGQIGIHDNFFDLGGDSMLGLQVISRIRKDLGTAIPAVALYEAPTISALAEYLQPQTAAVQDRQETILAERRHKARQEAGRGIAIIGMAGYFPGAKNVEQLWENLCNGAEAIRVFSDEELLKAGASPELIDNPNYVRARHVIGDIDQFDAPFFGYSPRDAELLDPQYRLFLECAWEALERSGYSNPDSYKGDIGIFAGVGLGTYYMLEEFAHLPQNIQMPLTVDKDAFATTVSYKLDLRGPSLTIQTFCSTSLVATHIACQNLLNGECDLALAGGITIRIPQELGYVYQEGGMESPDGRCRSFDDQANGMSFGDGVGVVVLKRLEDALEDGDLIHAVIKGSAVNNDGALKVGYTAPSVAGQAKAISMALESAGLPPEAIGYVEAHGTATKLGDPIEIAALTQAFRRQTDRKQYCAIGSLKTNVGHLDRAAGVTGLIKAALAVKHGFIPPSLHFERPNPEIDFENSPFFVNTQLLEWPRQNGAPRRAGVNSLGLGGTNAYAIVEEPPARSPSGPSRPWQLLLLSARTGAAVDTMTANLARYLRENAETNLADVAYTLQVGRRTFPYRRLVVCRDREDALQALEPADSLRALSHYQPDVNRRIAFMFPGIGDHYLQMARNLYEQEAVFKDAVEQCSRILQPYLGVEVRELLYPPEGPTPPVKGDPLDLRAMLRRDDHPSSPAAQRLNETAVAHPVVFVIEYALARLLMAWGIRPQAMVGYSLGEYVAACLSGVFSLRDALILVAKRAQMIQALPAGCMLAVSLSEEDVQPLLTETISLAAHNGQNTCILAGPPEAIDRLESDLTGRDVACCRLETTRAFHSSMMTPLVEQVMALLETVQLNPPQIPYLSNVTGTWITAQQATDPGYWARHMCQPIRFCESLEELLQEQDVLLLEVGPGQALGSFAKQHPACSREQVALILPTMRSAYEHRSDQAILLETLGKLWMLGVKPDWQAFYEVETRHLQPLPTYPFERQSYWVGSSPRQAGETRSAEWLGGREARAADLIDAAARKEIADWFYLPGWKQTAPHTPNLSDEGTGHWLLFADENGLGSRVAAWLEAHGQAVVVVRAGEVFEQLAERQFVVRPRQREDYVALLSALRETGLAPARIVHMWGVTSEPSPSTVEAQHLARILDRGFNSLIGLAQAAGDSGLESCALSVVSSQVLAVTGHEALCPEKATLIGPCRVIPVEYPNMTCRLIDVALEPPGGQAEALLANLMGELSTDAGDPVIGLRRHQRWVESFEPISLPAPSGKNAPIVRPGGVYMVTGGLGGIGLAIAGHLAQAANAKLVLIGRSGLPPRAEWAGLLAAQGSENGVGYKIRRVQDLEASGAEVLVLAADVADEAQMRAAVGQAVAHFGALHGVIHAAGVPGKGLIQLKTPEMAAEVLAPKVQGTLVLERVLQAQGIKLDFLVLFSSLTSITGGGPGQVDYCAANAFLDAHAQRHAGNERLTVSIDWGEWQWNAWEEGLAGLSEGIRTYLQENRERFGITFEEGGDVLARVLSRGLPQVIVSTEEFRPAAGADGRLTIASLLDWGREPGETWSKHPRPVLGVSYVAPRDELEHKIAAVWSDVLGISEIGLNDNFFELGGNSLIGLELVRRLQGMLDGQRLPARVLYEAPTVGTLARFVGQGSESEEIVDRGYARGEERRQRSQQRKQALRTKQATE